jgi:hypothetical protein
MFEIEGKLVSAEILSNKFVCDLGACKGACCVAGDSGAPLEESELAELEQIQEKIELYLRPEGLAAIREQGPYVRDVDGDLVTPLVNGAECAYVVFDERGTALCGIEKAWKDGVISFRKPVSCHLYPIRVAKFKDGSEALNYDRWKVCDPARVCGQKLEVKVYRFLKEAIIRKYGDQFFGQLEEADKHWSAINKG